MSDVTFDMAHNRMDVHRKYAEPWRVTLADTGETSMAGGRLLRVREYIENDECFCFTYGDGVGNVDIRRTLEFHRSHGRLATMTAVQPPGRFGALGLQGDTVHSFQEKPTGDGGWINGGFFILSPKVIRLMRDDSTVWEREPLEQLAKDDQLRAIRHDGFWQPMDTLRDKLHLESLWQSGEAPWKVW
jgi:glucose-1-phosphate cytidylyltransferase